MTRSVKRTVSCKAEAWPLKRPFVISRGTMSTCDAVIVEIGDGRLVGRGEAQGVGYKGETVERMISQIASVASAIEAGAGREELDGLLLPGGARNAVDCALWDLELKRDNVTIWDRLGIEPKELVSTATISIGTPAAMVEEASAFADYPLLKIKLDANNPIERLLALRTLLPSVRLVIDANCAWSFEQLSSVMPALVKFGIEMIEQPLPPEEDHQLAGWTSPIPLCADESCDVAADIAALKNRYSMVNIKLDKSGGLTEALKMVSEAQRVGLDIMVGCMLGTSLSMAPAFVIGQFARVVDLDGPILLAEDRNPAIVYRTGIMGVPPISVWGG